MRRVGRLCACAASRRARPPPRAAALPPRRLSLPAGDLSRACSLGHEMMGIVEEVGAEVRQLAPGDRVVVCSNISVRRFGSLAARQPASRLQRAAQHSWARAAVRAAAPSAGRTPQAALSAAAPRLASLSLWGLLLLPPGAEHLLRPYQPGCRAWAALLLGAAAWQPRRRAACPAPPRSKGAALCLPHLPAGQEQDLLFGDHCAGLFGYSHLCGAHAWVCTRLAAQLSCQLPATARQAQRPLLPPLVLHAAGGYPGGQAEYLRVPLGELKPASNAGLHTCALV